MEELAQMCGLRDALARAEQEGWLGDDPSTAGIVLVDTLREGVRQRARSTIDPDRTSTALAWLLDFMVASRRVPFRPLRFAGDLDHSGYNMETFELLYEYIRRRGSRQKGREGEEIASDTIDGYISAIKTLASFEARCSIVLGESKVLLPAASKATRKEQPAKSERQLRRGIRAQHFHQLISMGYHRGSHRRIIEWAAALTAWNVLLRGGEVGVVPRAPFDPSRDITFGAIEVLAPSAESAWRPWLNLWICPIKDGPMRRRTGPMQIRRRGLAGIGCPRGSDPMCVYDAIVAAWEAQTDQPFPSVGRVTGPLADVPFFRCSWKRGSPVWNTDDTRALAMAMATALGLDPSEFGGKSFRIGGATDWRAKLGADSERLIKQRGRWKSDIALAYQRSLAQQHLEASVAVGDVSSADMEALCPGWVQPA